MAILTKSQTQSSHWYRSNGTACHRLPRVGGGGMRPTTIRDAKRLGLYPSVTSILSVLAKPQLDKWKMRQVALASMRLERAPAESEAYFCDRIIAEAFSQVEQAADLGSQIHEALEKHFEGVAVPDELQVYTDPVIRWKEAKHIEFVERELCVVNKDHGFAGTMDVACRYGKRGIGVIDFKTRKTKPGQEVTPYDGQAMQIAAYGATYWGEDQLDRLFGANVYISTTEPGRIEVCRYTPVQLRQEWEAFKAICAIWRHLKGYDPRVSPSEPKESSEDKQLHVGIRHG
jgi:hypothetical protein